MSTSTEQEQAGAWVTYDYDRGPYAISLHSSAEQAARAAARRGYGRTAFWSFGEEFGDAIALWESPDDFRPRTTSEPT